MARDYASVIRSLRLKADDRAVTPEERVIILAKVKELEEKYDVHSVPNEEFNHGINDWWTEYLKYKYRAYDYQNGPTNSGYYADQESTADSGNVYSGRMGWNPDAGKYRRTWRPDEQDLISPEFRYDWEDGEENAW